MATLETIQPYVEQLFDDAEVRKQLARANANLRAARARAGKTKSKKQALTDERLRQRIIQSAQALALVATEIKAGPEKQRKRSRRRGLLLLAVVGAGAYVMINEDARNKLMALVGSDSNEAAHGH
jgi:hypothetical protein